MIGSRRPRVGVRITVMPGLSLYDIGDLIRTSTSTSAEDERDLDV